MIWSLDSKVLRTFKILYILFIQETIFFGDLKKLRSNIFNFKFNHFMEYLSAYKSLLLCLSDKVIWKFFILSLRSLVPEGFKPVSIIDIIFSHVRSVSFFIITINELSKPMSIILFESLKCGIFFKVGNNSVTFKLKEHRKQ